MRDEAELRQRLTGLAERTAPPPRPGLAEVVEARHRQRRRRTVGVTALAAAAVAAVVVAVPVLTGGTPDPVSSTAASATGAGAEALAGPPRGSLARDAAFVEAVRQLPWTSSSSSGGVLEPPLDTRRVVFAGEVAGARWALVVGPDRQTDAFGPASAGGLAIAWFSGPPGAAAEEMALDSVPYGVDPTLPLARADSRTGALVVLTAPGDVVEVSARPDVAADGSVTREWRAVDATLGVVVTTVPPSDAFTNAVRYRVERDGVAVAESVPDGLGLSFPPAPAVAVASVRGEPAAGDDPLVRSGVDGVLAATGLPAAEVTVASLWAGDVPGPEGRPGRVVLLAVTLPSGAVYLTAPFEWTGADGSGVGGSCGSGIVPAGVPLPERPVAVRCDVIDGSWESAPVSSLVVLAPGGDSARVVDMTGVALAEFPLTDGVAVVPAPERAATVEVSGDDPPSLTRLRLLSSADLGD